MNDIKIKTDNEKVEIFIDGKKLEYVDRVVLTFDANDMRTIEIRQLTNNVEVDGQVDRIIELPKDNSNQENHFFDVNGIS